MMLVALFMGPESEPSPSRDSINVSSVLITLIDQVEVTARLQGMLSSVAVRESQLVKKGDVLAQIDDAEAELTKQRSKIELETAREQAESDVHIRAAKKSLQVSAAELRRSEEAVKRFKKSVSDTELDRLRLLKEQAELSIEQSELEKKIAGFTKTMKKNEYDLATLHVELHKIKSPLTGMVVQINRKPGEWVEPGQAVMRILRIDRLRAEGFIHASELAEDLAGRPVTLTVDLPGKPKSQFTGSVVFVHPEVNPVSGQVRFWAEIENTDLRLRPGLKASLTIDPKRSSSSQQSAVSSQQSEKNEFNPR